ncbi:MAG: hypothetical protein U1E60_31470 [Reyranellaceae bacterium]
MPVKRKMHLAAYLRTGPTARYAGAWRHPSAPLHDIWDAERSDHLARLLENARVDVGFVDLVVPELPRHGLFGKDYESTRLRDHLGAPGPTSVCWRQAPAERGAA